MVKQTTNGQKMSRMNLQLRKFVFPFFLSVFFISSSYIYSTPIYSLKNSYSPAQKEISYGKNGMVTTQHFIATEVGEKILNKGGNAFDASIAIGFTLAVVLPRAGNIGGGGFMVMFDDATQNLINLLDIPENYSVLWLQGGASLQFSMVPMNLLPNGGTADYIDTGSWSAKAVIECQKFGNVNVIGSSKDSVYSYIPKNVVTSEDALYLHITSNNTIYGTQYKDYPEIKNTNSFLVADMSSDILSKPVDISQFGLIYAGAQKNMGPAGVTLVIIRKDLLDSNFRDVPTMMRYKTHSSKDSMFNTPPVFSVCVVNETLKWIQSLGGLKEMEIINERKAEKLYTEIERNSLFKSPINKEDRSTMNVPFVFLDKKIDDKIFLDYCLNKGLTTLKGHRSVGGFRASIYNAMPEGGVDALIEAMQHFEKNYYFYLITYWNIYSGFISVYSHKKSSRAIYIIAQIGRV